jgi:hypothetical protein
MPTPKTLPLRRPLIGPDLESSVRKGSPWASSTFPGDPTQEIHQGHLLHG